jgi:hypothetical protein
MKPCQEGIYNETISICNDYFENVSKCKFLGTTLTNEWM